MMLGAAYNYLERENGGQKGRTAVWACIKRNGRGWHVQPDLVRLLQGTNLVQGHNVPLLTVVVPAAAVAACRTGKGSARVST